MKKEKIFGKEIASKMALLGVSPIDGRYAATGESLNEYFSEYGLIKHRLFVEISWLEYFIKMVNDVPVLDGTDLDDYDFAKIWDIYYSFDIKSAMRVKEIEKTTNHDVKSVEYYIAEELRKKDLSFLVPLVHFGCTSEDINNTSYALMIKGALEDVWIPAAEKLITKLTDLAFKNVDVIMLGHTHGQKATPTSVGKEFAVFVFRLSEVLDQIKQIKIKGKFNGATGCYSADSTVFPDENWPILCSSFVTECLGLSFNPLTTQIEPHDYMAELFDAIRHFNNIILDCDVDMWMYISKDYIKQIPVAGEVGSSTMPHKVNPIMFENSEANADMSNAILASLSNKLTRSRWQRDLSDSSSQRYIGTAFGCSLLAINNLIRGLNKCEVHVDVIGSELNDSWEVLAEPIQTMLRKYGISDAYEQLKSLTRGRTINAEDIHTFVSSLDVLSDEDKKILMDLTPATYTGYASSLVDLI